MKSFIYKLLDIEPNQATRVFLMLGMGFFMGVFLATLDVSASALFLQSFDEKTDLPFAILLSGAVGIIITGLYNFLQSRIGYIPLAIGTMLFIVTFMGGVQYVLETNVLNQEVKYIYGAAFVMMGPINYLALLLFWGVFGRIFNLRESKKIIGSIDTGQLIASIIALFSIPILQTYMSTAGLLLISAIASVGVFVMILIISFSGLFTEEGKRKTGRVSYGRILRSKYVMLLSGFVIVSIIALTFVDFAFLNATAQQFSDEALANFLALFEATVVIFSFLFQTFVTDRIISLYGLRFALIVNPLLILGFTALATLLGVSFGYVKEGNELFIFFFIIIAMSKLFMDSLKDALDGPAFKLYFLPIDSVVRFDVSTKVEGVITAFAGLLAGTLFILINQVNLPVIYVTVLTIPFLFFWYLITNRMHGSYKETLQRTLIRNKEKQNVVVRQEFSVNQVLENEVLNKNQASALYSLKLMKKLEPALYESTIIKLANNGNEQLKDYALQELKTFQLEYEKGSDIHSIAIQALGGEHNTTPPDLSDLQLEKKAKSISPEDRIEAAKVLRLNITKKNIYLLLELLRDMNKAVRHEAIKTARKVQSAETWPVLIEMLDSSEYGAASQSALITAGEEALHSLEMAFSKSGQRDTVMMKIITVIGRIGGEKALTLLWNKIDYPDKRIASQVLIWLRYFNYEAQRELERQTITELLEDDISKAIWNMSAVEELPDENSYDLLKSALKEETKTNVDHIFMLLSLLYDKESIQLVRENIESGTSEGIAFALELLDIFIDKDLRPKLFPLFDDIDRIDKLRQLQVFFPREEYNHKEVLNFILNRTFDQANRWTKASALYAMAFMDEFKVSKAMIAQLFNPDYMLQETAAWVIYHKDRVVFEKVAKRLPDEDRKFLEDSISKNQLIDGLDDGAFLHIEIAMFLKSLPELENINGFQLCEMADKIQISELKPNQTYDLQSSDSQKPILIIADGEVEVEFDEEQVAMLSKGGIFGEAFMLQEDLEIKTIRALEKSVIFSITTTHFYSILGDNHQLVHDLIGSMSKRLENQTIRTL